MAPNNYKTASLKSVRGFTLLEMIITLGILSVVVAAAVPLAKNAVRRQKEVELRRALRDIRQSIDAYKKFCDPPPNGFGRISPLDRSVDDECYPPSMDVLIEGVTPVNGKDKIRFLRRLPIDPMTGTDKWGTKSVQDESGSGSSKNVFDVFTKSEGTALDGTKYKDW